MDKAVDARVVHMPSGVCRGVRAKGSERYLSRNISKDGRRSGRLVAQAEETVAADCGEPEPLYSRMQERFNTISHVLGVILGVFALGWLLKAVSLDPLPNKMVAAVVYCVSLVVLYAMSATYHMLPQGRAKRAFRVADHCTIYLLIAGCYTPVCLTLLWDSPMGLPILLIEWGLAALGIILNALRMRALSVKVFSMVSYLVMGWMVMFVPFPLLLNAGVNWLVWLLVGGVLYTVGIVFYVLGKWHPRMHCVWHLFVLFGSAFQLAGFVQLF